MNKIQYAVMMCIFLSGAFTLPVRGTDLVVRGTDLVVRGLVGPDYFIYQESQPVQFEICNDNILTADRYISFVTIEDEEEQVVYDAQAEGRDIEPFTNEIVTMPIEWRPVMTGKYRLSVEIEFSDDIDISNNSLSMDVYALVDCAEAVAQFTAIIPELGHGDPEAKSDGKQGISFAEAFHWVRAQNPSINNGSINWEQNPVMVESSASN